MENPIEYEDNLDEAGLLADDGDVYIAPKRKMKPGMLVALGVVGLIVLAGAAYLGGRLLTGQGLGNNAGPLVVTNEDGSVTSRVSVEFEGAEELPQEKPIISGVLDRREDNSLFLGTGQMIAIGSEDGIDIQYDGPVVEVVVNHETVVWKDVTDFEQDLGGVVQQVVEPGTLDDLRKNSMIIVWGEKQGDRIIAKTLSYHP